MNCLLIIKTSTRVAARNGGVDMHYRLFRYTDITDRKCIKLLIKHELINVLVVTTVHYMRFLWREINIVACVVIWFCRIILHCTCLS